MQGQNGLKVRQASMKETGLPGWGGRIRNFAFRMIGVEPERFRKTAALIQYAFASSLWPAVNNG